MILLAGETSFSIRRYFADFLRNNLAFISTARRTALNTLKDDIKISGIGRQQKIMTTVIGQSKNICYKSILSRLLNACKKDENSLILN